MEPIRYNDFGEAEVTDQILNGKIGTVRYWGETKDHLAMCLKMEQKLVRGQVVRIIGKQGDLLLVDEKPIVPQAKMGSRARFLTVR